MGVREKSEVALQVFWGAEGEWPVYGRRESDLILRGLYVSPPGAQVSCGAYCGVVRAREHVVRLMAVCVCVCVYVLFEHTSILAYVS